MVNNDLVKLEAEQRFTAPDGFPKHINAYMGVSSGVRKDTVKKNGGIAMKIVSAGDDFVKVGPGSKLQLEAEEGSCSWP